MELSEFLTGFRKTSLRGAAKHVAIAFLSANPSYLYSLDMQLIEQILTKEEDVEISIAHHWAVQAADIIKNNETLLAIHRLIMDGEQDDLVEWIVTTLGGINNATIRAQLENQSKGISQSLTDGALRSTIVLNTMTEEELKEVSLQNNIDITGTGESKFLGGFFSDGPNWTLVKKIAEQIAGPDKSQQGISPFCPDCAEDAPEGADHCISCGRELPLIICPSCDTENLPQAKFCMSCGEKR